jgi:hypothetical protein
MDTKGRSAISPTGHRSYDLISRRCHFQYEVAKPSHALARRLIVAKYSEVRS